MQVKKELTGTARLDIKESYTPRNYHEVSLEYYLLEVEDSNKCQDRNKVYGIQIIKTEVGKYNTVNTETELIPNISPDKEGVKGILDKLIRNKVTPIALHNVIEDIIGVVN